MQEAASLPTALELYKQLVGAFEVSPLYKVSFSREVSEDVLQIISYLKGDLHAQDLVPFPTSLTLTVRIPGGLTKYFHQDSNTYMQVFDENAFRDFAVDCLKLAPSNQIINI